jgi:hypothetical protein
MLSNHLPLAKPACEKIATNCRAPRGAKFSVFHAAGAMTVGCMQDFFDLIPSGINRHYEL